MRTFLLIFNLILISNYSFCQETEKYIDALDSTKFDEVTAFVSPIQVMPKYKHGTNEELMELIHAQVEYPVGECLEGTTFLSFVINKEGKVESPRIFKSISKKVDEQLLKLILKYEFEPGEYRGEVCDVTFNMPFRIRF